MINMPIRLVEELGGEVLVHGLIGDTPMIVRCAADRFDHTPKEILLCFEAEKAHWFDAITGLRIE